MAYENTGYLAFANALTNAGTQFGDALKERNKRQYLADLAPLVQNGNWAGAAQSAFNSGDEGLGLKFSILDQEQRKIAEQRAYDAKALQGLDGTGGGAPVGVTGGVTPNPQPQPMQLPGASTDASLPRGMRNLNPGNIEDGPFARSQAGYVGNDGRFAKFDTMEHGVTAQAGLLGSYANKGINTLAGIINRYAPPAENGKATQNYMQFVARKIGVDPNAPLDLSDPNMRQKVALAMSEFENGRPVLGGGPKPVQVADASGAIPQSAVPGQAPQQPQADPSAPLMAKRDNIMRALSQQGISDNARQQLTTMLSNINSDLTRLANNPTTKLQNEIAQRDIIGQQNGLTGEDATRYRLTGNLPSKSEKAPTEGQAKAARYASVMNDAESLLSSKDAKGQLSPDAQAMQDSATGWTGRFNQVAEAAPFGIAHGFETPDYQRYASAKESFLTAKLRDDSGATIGTKEYIREEKSMFPQPGDSEKLIAEKATRRKRAIETMAMEAHPDFQKTFKGSSGAAAASPVIDEARAAIARGADRARVIERLRANGVDASGL